MIYTYHLRRFIIFLTIFISIAYFSVPTVYASAAREDAIEAAIRKLQEPTATLATSTDSSLLPKAPAYILGEDDQLEITVWRYLQPTTKEDGQETPGEYFIRNGDTLEISVWQWPDLLKDVIVRPDGKISYPLIGEVDVAGLTFPQVQDIITEKLQDYIKSPQVSVMIKQFGSTIYGAGYTGKIVDLPFVKIDDLSTFQTIRPDGKISFPLLGDVQAAGLTLPQLSEDLRQRISKLVADIQVTVAVKEFGGKKVIVLGEVGTPGVYKPTGEVTLLEAVASAGGYSQDAILKNVIVIRGNMDKPEVKVCNLLAAIRGTDSSQNVEVRGGDIVYVPRSHISNLNYLLNQILTPLVNSSTAVGAIKAVRMGPSTKK